MASAQHRGEVLLVGLLGHLDAVRAGRPRLAQASDDVVDLSLDQGEVGASDVAVRPEDGEEVGSGY